MKKVEIDENSGFCFGVRRAIEKTEEQIKVSKGSGRKIYRNIQRIYRHHCFPLNTWIFRYVTSIS